MSWLPALTTIAAVAGGLVPLVLAIGFWRDPEAAMARANHRREALPQVMVGRYLGFAALAFAAAAHGDPAATAFLFATFAFISFFDAWLYARQGQPARPHAAAGLGALLVLGLAVAQALTV